MNSKNYFVVILYFFVGFHLILGDDASTVLPSLEAEDITNKTQERVEEPLNSEDVAKGLEYTNSSVDIKLNTIEEEDELESKGKKKSKLEKTKLKDSSLSEKISARSESLMISEEGSDSQNGDREISAEEYADEDGSGLSGDESSRKTKEVSPLNEKDEGMTQDIPDEPMTQVRVSSPPSGGTSWLGEFLAYGRGTVWKTLNIVLLIFIVVASILCLFRLLALRSCTPLLSRTLYLLVLVLAFTAGVFTAINLIHLIFGGKEGLPILLTLILTHTPAPCLTTALVMLIHRILLTARLSWPVSCEILGRVCTVLILLSVLGDICVALMHSTPFLLTCRVTLAAIAILPIILFMVKYSKVIEVSKVLKREFNGELKLMVQPTDSIAQEQHAVRALLRDILPTWATLLLSCCVFALLLWICNLSISVFFAVARVPIWLWWVFHTTNVVCQIFIIVILIYSCIITQNMQQGSLWYKIFIIPREVFNNTQANGSANEQRNFVYERVSYSSGPESSQRTSSTQNEGDDSDRIVTSLNPHPSPLTKPRVTLQRSATFNCAPRLPNMYGYVPGYSHLLPQGYQRTGSFVQIPQSQVPVRFVPHSMLLQEGGFVRFNMPLPQSSAVLTPEQSEEVMKNYQDARMYPPPVDIEYNSLRRFPRRYQPKNPSALTYDDGKPKFNPNEIRISSPVTSPGFYTNIPHQAVVQAASPVSPYHALPLLQNAPTIGLIPDHLQAANSLYPRNEARSPYQTPPALPSRAGSFRNHYAAPASSPHSVASSPVSSPYSPIPISQRHHLSRPTSPLVAPNCPPPLPPEMPFQQSTGQEFVPVIATSSKNASNLSLSSPTHNTYSHTSQQNSPGENKYSLVPVSSQNYSPGEMQISESKSLENTVREILSSAERPLIRPRRHPLHSSARHSRRQRSLRNSGDQSSIYANANGNDAIPSTSNNFIPMEYFATNSHDYMTDSEIQDNEVRTHAPNLKRNHSTAGCFYPPQDRKDSFCQTDDEGNKYSSFRLSQLRSKPSDWYGTWAGRRKSKHGAYSIDPSDAVDGPEKDKESNITKRLSSSRASLLSLYSKLKNRREKPAKDDSSDDATTNRDEISCTSISDETPTPSERNDSVSLTTEEETPLDDVLEELKTDKEPEADWTTDILSRSSVLSDFYKFRERPPPLPEVSEVDA